MHRQNLKLLLRKVYEEMHLQEITLFVFDLDLGVKVIRNVTQYPLHHVIYAPTKFEVATSNGLGEDTITRNVTDGRTDRRTDGRTDRRTTDRLWYEINIPYFSYEKAGIIKLGKERLCHITKQLMHSFSVNIRISQPSKVMFTSTSPR